MQHHELIYVKFSELLARYGSDHRIDPTVPERLARWQGAFLAHTREPESAPTFLSRTSFMHYLEALGSQPILDAQIPFWFEQYLQEITHTNNLFIKLDLPDPDWKL